MNGAILFMPALTCADNLRIMPSTLARLRTIDRCVCVDISFAELKRLARRRRCGLAGLSKETGCCTCCGCCEGYVLRMLQTGRTRFQPDEPSLPRASAAA